jgi:hypothetical protein
MVRDWKPLVWPYIADSRSPTILLQTGGSAEPGLACRAAVLFTSVKGEATAERMQSPTPDALCCI